MGLKAISSTVEYLSFEIDCNTWQKLKKDKEFKNTLLMPCCKNKAIMKNSSLGLQYFSHPPTGICSLSKGESEEHLLLKKYFYDFLKDANYNVEIEKTLKFDDYYLRADIYLEINDKKIAFEIQSSNQTLMTTQERSNKYTDNGIIVVWLNLFKNRTYNYEKFNISNKIAKIYEVIKQDDTYSINISTIPKLLHTIELKPFILNNIVKSKIK